MMEQQSSHQDAGNALYLLIIFIVLHAFDGLMSETTLKTSLNTFLINIHTSHSKCPSFAFCLLVIRGCCYNLY